MRNQKIKVLIVEDSPVVQELITDILGADPKIQIIGAAHDGVEAIDAIAAQKPDVVTMDVQMPTMNGYEATRAIMASNPVPIVVISGQIDPADLTTACQALGAGALMALPKPVGPSHPNYAIRSKELLSAVKLMAGVKVVRRTASYTFQQTPLSVPLRPATSPSSARKVEAIGIGASTGGPGALEKILAGMPSDFPAPIFIVQHIAKGFIDGMAEWLGRCCALTVRIATHGEPAAPGGVYLAPDGVHLQIAAGGRIQLRPEKEFPGFCPGVTPLFRSLANVYGPGAIGVLLTGMGSDGVDGLRQMKADGALTIVQDESSSVVFGMPKEAIETGAAELILNPKQIGETLVGYAMGSTAQKPR
jgi:two-component system, chemotaxis family, protein-glutamate methylesterase/glutaminase